MYSIYLDLPNILFILNIILLFAIIKKIPSWLTVLLCVLAFTPFFVNDLLFPAAFMPDQFRYVNFVQELRSLNYNYQESNTVQWAGWIFALMPMPIVETIKSLGFFNRFSISLLIIWLYVKKNIRGLPLFVLIFYPSLLLYSSLALRDIFILISMVVAIILYIDGRKIYSILFSTPLIFLKAQNFILFLFLIACHEIGIKNTFMNKIKYLLMFIFLLLILLFENEILQSLNIYRIAMHREDGIDEEGILLVKDLKDLIIIGVPSALYFLLKPLPWEAVNFLQLIQSFENFLVLILLVYSFVLSFKKNVRIGIKWSLFLLLSFMVYGLIVSNFGTAARYKFPFVLITLIGMFYELSLDARKKADSNVKCNS